jgi:hypothetical protein
MGPPAAHPDQLCRFRHRVACDEHHSPLQWQHCQGWPELQVRRRPGSREVLISRFLQNKSPGISRGFFLSAVRAAISCASAQEVPASRLRCAFGRHHRHGACLAHREAGDALCGNKVGAPGETRSGCICRLHPFCPTLISSNLASARSNLALKSHIASRISRKVAEVLALSACPNAKMLLFRRYPMIVGSEIL